MRTMKLLSSTAALALLLGTAYGVSANADELLVDSVQIAQDSSSNAAGASPDATTGTEQSETGGASETDTQAITGQSQPDSDITPGVTEDQSGSGTTTGQTEMQTAPSTTTGIVPEQPGASEGQTEAELAARADEIIGQPVLNAQGDKIGEVEDLVVDPNGQVYAVVGVGGFLGLGEHDVAISAKELEFGPEQTLYTGFSSTDDFKEMPEYSDTDWRSLKS